MRRWLNRRYEVAFARFSVGRAGRLLGCGAALLLIVSVTTLPAFAGPKGAGLGAFSVFDVTDSKGIHVSQYELSLDTGGITAPLKIWLSSRLLFGWNLYRYSISFVAYLVDWTINMSWLGLITDPLNRAAQLIRTQLITPAGLAGFMLVVSAVVGGTRMLFGRMGKGLWDVLSACVVATLVAGVLATPVATFTGDPLTKARQVGVSVANLITSDGGTLPDTAGEQTPQGDLQVGKTLIDALIRPTHGLTNYGVNFTEGQHCTDAYDKALRAGPYWDPDATKTREAVGRCDGKLGDYAKYSIYTSSASMGVFLVTGLLICALIVLVCALLFIAVMMLGWNLLKLVITAVIGIGPGDTRGPMIRNATQALVSLVYVASSMVALAVVMAVINQVFGAQDTTPMLRFIIVDLVVITGFVVVVQTWTAHRRGAESWAEKLMTRMKQTVPKPTIGSRVGGWLKGPVGGQASVYGDLGGPAFAGAGAGGGRGARPLTGTGMTVGRMLRPVANSNAFALAKFAGATAATGGVGAVAGTVAVARGGARTVQIANTVRRTYAATQQGARRASTGNPTLDVAIGQTARAHDWVQRKAVQTHQLGFDALGHAGQKVRSQAPGAVMTAAAVLGPTVEKRQPPARHTQSQPYDQPTPPRSTRSGTPGGRGSAASPRPGRAAADATFAPTRPAATPAGVPAAAAGSTRTISTRPGAPSASRDAKPAMPVVVEPAGSAATRVMNLVQHSGQTRPVKRETRPTDQTP